MLHQTLYGSFVVKYDAPYYSSWLRFRAGLCLWKNIPKWNIEMCRSKHMGVNWTVLMKCETLSLIYYQCTEKFSGLLLPPPPFSPPTRTMKFFILNMAFAQLLVFDKCLLSCLPHQWPHGVWAARFLFSPQKTNPLFSWGSNHMPGMI